MRFHHKVIALLYLTYIPANFIIKPGFFIYFSTYYIFEFLGFN